jgi:hypothetical protein
VYVPAADNGTVDTPTYTDAAVARACTLPVPVWPWFTEHEPEHDTRPVSDNATQEPLVAAADLHRREPVKPQAQLEAKVEKAQIRIDGKSPFLGYFADDDEAAASYREVAATIVQGGALPAQDARHRGVYLDHTSGKRVAQTCVDEKQQYRGWFADEAEAAATYRETVAATSQGRALPTPPPARAGHSSQHRGVSWHKARGKWRAQILIDGKSRFLGCFADEEEAAAAYREADDERRLRKRTSFTGEKRL